MGMAEDFYEPRVQAEQEENKKLRKELCDAYYFLLSVEGSISDPVWMTIAARFPKIRTRLCELKGSDDERPIPF